MHKILIVNPEEEEGAALTALPVSGTPTTAKKALQTLKSLHASLPTAATRVESSTFSSKSYLDAYAHLINAVAIPTSVRDYFATAHHYAAHLRSVDGEARRSYQSALESVAELSASKGEEATESTTAPFNIADFGLAIDAALASAAEAVESADVAEDEKADLFVERAIAITQRDGMPAIRRIVRFLADGERESYGRSAIVSLCERGLAAEYDAALLETLSTYLGEDNRSMRYTAISAIGRRKGESALIALEQALPVISDDPVLTTLARGYIEARGANGSKTASAA